MTRRALARAATAATALSAATVAAVLTSTAAGAAPQASLTSVAARPRVAGVSSTNNLAPEWAEHPAVTGATPLENPQDWAAYYGYDNDGPLTPAPGSNVEASKSEPDKNTYLVLDGLHGADPSYDYGTHFLYQGHETGLGGYITRVNLDADAAHKVTLIATRDVTGAPLPTFDGSVWDPFTQTLLFSAEAGNHGGIWESGADVGAQVRDISGALGRGGYEGIQIDSAGQVWIVEDTGGAAAGANKKGKQPNSFVYRFVPTNPGDLTAGRLQALAVLGPKGAPVAIDADSPLETALHTYGVGFRTQWITIHDTATDGAQPFDANALAKTAHATPFKRPENGQFQPGDGLRDFFFTETGDTNALSPYNADKGGFGGVFHIAQRTPTSDTGHLTLLFAGDLAHTGFDNLSFLTDRQLLVVEDAGDTVHAQRNALDSGFVLDVKHDYGDGAAPERWLGEGRDPSATIDAGLAGTPGFRNEGDNEITGIHVSDGDATVAGLIGTAVPHPFDGRWRVFWTQQHGDNVTWELTPA
jgi:hypothetical protein